MDYILVITISNNLLKGLLTNHGLKSYMRNTWIQTRDHMTHRATGIPTYNLHIFELYYTTHCSAYAGRFSTKSLARRKVFSSGRLEIVKWNAVMMSHLGKQNGFG